MKVVIFTSNNPRHNYFIYKMSEQLDVVGVLKEDKGSYYVSDEPIIQKHMEGFREQEDKFFGDYRDYRTENVLEVNKGESNSDSVFNWLQSKKPDIILLFGTSIIKERIMEEYDEKVVNIHLGLSPYYKGTATNFWPLVNHEPQCVGATIHVAVLKVDAGPILHQVRPNISVDDTTHSIGCKVIKSAIDVMPEVVKKYYNNDEKTYLQKKEGKIYRRKDFNSEAIIQLNKNIENGMINEYISNKEEIDKNYPIITIEGI